MSILKQKSDKQFSIIFIAFGILYCLISLVNHYNFRTYALDLGAYTNALYDYSHFQFNDCTVFKQTAENLLADHFDFYLILLSPFSFIFKSYTLLLAQLFFVLIGGLGVYKYFRQTSVTAHLALPASLYFYLFFGVFSAISYDYHSNVIAASLVPWLFYSFKQRKMVISGILLLFIVISKENISLWMTFVFIGLMVEFKSDKTLRNYCGGFALASFLYFILITTVVMPALSNNNSYPHFNYAALGSNYSEAFLFLVQHPVDSIRMLFVNQTQNPLGDYVKLELHVLLLISGLPLLIRKPHFFIMLIPIYVQKFFHDNYLMWGIYGQYSIEFAPILAIGIFSAIGSFKSRKWSKILIIIVLIGAFASTFRLMDNTVVHNDKSKIRVYKSNHYYRDFDVKQTHQLLATIPADAIVSAQSPFLPQLALRDYIYQFPIVKDATYIVYSKNEGTYPLEKDTFFQQISYFENSPEWTVFAKNDYITILFKKQ